MTPERFFAVALPQIASRNATAFKALRGTVVFAIADHGAWTVRLGDQDRPVEDGAASQADLSLFFTDEAFGHLLDNRLDVEAAIARKAVGYEGDIGLLEKLGFLLTSGGTVDGVQLDQVPMGFKRA